MVKTRSISGMNSKVIFKITKIFRNEDMEKKKLINDQGKLITCLEDLKEIWNKIKMENTYSNQFSSNNLNFDFISFNSKIEYKSNSEDYLNINNLSMNVWDDSFYYENNLFVNSKDPINNNSMKFNINMYSTQSWPTENSSTCFKKRSKRSAYKKFDINYKKDCLQLLNIMTIQDVCFKKNVPLRSLKRWIDVGYRRKIGCVRKTRDLDMENKIISWYNDMKRNGILVTPGSFNKKALQFKSNDPNIKFSSSNGWLTRIKKMYNLQLQSRMKRQINL